MNARILAHHVSGGRGSWPDMAHEERGRTGAITSLDPEWEDRLSAAVDEITEKLELTFRLNELEYAVEELYKRSASFQVVLRSMKPHGGRLIKDMNIAVRPEEDGWVASFFDANVHASGETEIGAIDNLKSMIVDYLDQLSELPKEALGLEMRRCYEVLSEYLEPAHGANQR